MSMDDSTGLPENRLYAAAVEYALKGWKVLPIHTTVSGRCSCINPRKPVCKHPGKHPRTEHGVDDASSDIQQITRWWRKWPHANVGIATGADSNLFVIDIDPQHGGDDSLHTLEHERGSLPDTLQSETGGGGIHFYFTAPLEAIGNLTGVRPGIDLRTDSGYVVAPPSLHASGKEYCWEASTAEFPPVSLPEQWLAFLVERREQEKKVRQAASSTASVYEGSRNSTLFRLASGWREKGLDYNEIIALLELRNATICVPPLETDELREIAHSACRYPAGSPSSGERPVGDPPLPQLIADLLTSYIERPDSLIGEGVLIAGGILILAGAPGIGKSWIVIDLVIAASLGLHWLLAPCLPVRKCRVLIVGMETPDYIFRERLLAVIAARGVSEEFMDSDSLALCLPSHEWVALDTDEGLAYLIETIGREHIELLILDPFSRLHQSDENSAQEMGKVLANIDRLRAATGCAVVLVHHQRKGAASGRGGGSLDSVRGSGRLISDAQTVLLLEEAKSHLRLSVVKMNFGPAFEEVYLNQCEDGPLLVSGFLPLDSSQEKRERLDWVLIQVRAAGNRGVAPVELAALPGAPLVKAATMRLYLRSLLVQKHVTKIGEAKNTRWYASSP